MKNLLSLLAAFLLLPALAGANDSSQNWPQWRGPLASGVAPEGNPPLSWSESENVRFKVEIPGRGHASPVVWGDRIFVLTTIDVEAEAPPPAPAAGDATPPWARGVKPAKQRFVVMALSRRDGSVLWQRTAVETTPHEGHHLDATWASASPVTDGQRLFASFGSNGLFAYDLDGNLLWQVDLGDMSTRNGFGEGSSPALHGDTLVVNWDHEGDSFIVALDATTGKERWRRARPDEITSWATPLIVEHDGRLQVVVAATGFSRGYDLATGEEIWRAAGMTTNVIPSPVTADGVVYLMSGFRGNMLQAVSLAKAKGDVTGGEAILWTHDRHTPYVPSPVLYGDKLYFLKHFSNILSCLDARSGKVLFTEQRLEGITNVYASPVAAAGRIYIVDRDGDTVVLAHGDELKVLAHNRLEDGFEASPAIVGDEIYLRGRKHLYAIAAPAPTTSTSDTQSGN